MMYRALVRPLAAVLGTALATAALAQTAPSQTTPARASTPVVTDVGPPPAEERDSHGAIVLKNSPVRAQRDGAAPTSVMGNVAAPAEKVLKKEERRKAREAKQPRD